jgi:two-component system, chemotaxis family, protein-glutamate methylesterase/glutaminase
MAKGQKIRILVVDDSAVMRILLRSVIATDSALEIVGTAADGEPALRMIESLRPDLVLLDVEMPKMDGLMTLRQMRARNLRPPVIMCSALTQRGARVTIEALASGASDYVAKPSNQLGPAVAIQNLAHELLPKIFALTNKSCQGEQTQAQPSLSARRSLLPGGPAPLNQAITATPTVVVIGISTGGPAALDVLLPALPGNFPLPILIVQHMPELFTHLLAERLQDRCPLEVREAAAGDPVKAGTIYIARGNWHMEVVTQRPRRADVAGCINLTQGLHENHCRPAVDVLFRTASQIYGAGALGIVMTGMGSDGMLGAQIIRQNGGTVLAQDQATSAVWGMPGAVTQAGLAQKVLPLNAIAPEILRLCSRTPREAPALRESLV